MPLTLSAGSRGKEVKLLQSLLNFHLSSPNQTPLVEDGIFGPQTKARVVEFQKANRLQVDGIVGPETATQLAASTCNRVFRLVK